MFRQTRKCQGKIARTSCQNEQRDNRIFQIEQLRDAKSQPQSRRCIQEIEALYAVETELSKRGGEQNVKRFRPMVKKIFGMHEGASRIKKMHNTIARIARSVVVLNDETADDKKKNRAYFSEQKVGYFPIYWVFHSLKSLKLKQKRGE